MYKKDSTLLMMQLSGRIMEIADNRDKFTPGEFQNVIDAVIMAAYQEGNNAAMQRLDAGNRLSALVTQHHL
jgi:hypothetical protein